MQQIKLKGFLKAHHIYIQYNQTFNSLPDALKDASLMSGATTEGHARALSALEDPHLIINTYKEVLKRNLSAQD